MGYLGVDLFSAVEWLTSSQIGPFNAPCSNLNIPTRAINPNNSVKTFNKEKHQSENLSKTLIATYVYRIRWKGCRSEICEISVGLAP